MKTDLYTKSILTVIAVCLFVNTFTAYDFISKAHANEIDKINEKLNEPTEVMIVGIDPKIVIGVNIKQVLGKQLGAHFYRNDPDGNQTMSPVIYTVKAD